MYIDMARAMREASDEMRSKTKLRLKEWNYMVFFQLEAQI
jgi:hypothetical protein